MMFNVLGHWARMEGDCARAAEFLEESMTLSRPLGAGVALMQALHNLGYVARHRGDHRRSAALFGEGREPGMAPGSDRQPPDRARFLLLVNYRPEYSTPGGSKTYYTQVRIDPLPPESADELLTSLLGQDGPS